MVLGGQPPGRVGRRRNTFENSSPCPSARARFAPALVGGCTLVRWSRMRVGAGVRNRVLTHSKAASSIGACLAELQRRVARAEEAGASSVPVHVVRGPARGRCRSDRNRLGIAVALLDRHYNRPLSWPHPNVLVARLGRPQVGRLARRAPVEAVGRQSAAKRRFGRPVMRRRSRISGGTTRPGRRSRISGAMTRPGPRGRISGGTIRRARGSRISGGTIRRARGSRMCGGRRRRCPSPGRTARAGVG